MTKDMTHGKPMRLMLSFSLPILIGNIFQQFYNMVDAIIVGQTIGANALGAVGATGALTFLVFGFMFGMASGFSVIAAQRFGADDADGLRRSVATSVYLSIAVTVIVTAISMLTARPLLELMNTPEELIDDSFSYLIVIFAGTAALMFYNLLSGILRALGDSKTPLYFLILSSLLNIALDLLLIIVYHCGVAGAAYATVISQAVSAVLCFIYMMKKFPILHFYRRDWSLDTDAVFSQLRLGLPMALQSSIIAIGVIVMQSGINCFGSTVVSAFTAASKVEQIMTQPFVAIGTACATFAGQNLGAGRYDRIHQGAKASVILTVLSALASAALVLLLGKGMMHLFLRADQREAIRYGLRYLDIIIAFFLPLGLIFVFRSILQGVGKPFMPMMSGVIELVTRCVFTVLFAHLASYEGVCLASPIAWVGAALPLVIAYLVWQRQTKNLTLPTQTESRT